MTSVVDKYYRRIAQNIDNVTMKFDISALLVKSKELDSKIETNKNDISENLTLINSKTNIIDNQITAINSTLNDLKTKNNNSKYSIENFLYIILK